MLEQIPTAFLFFGAAIILLALPQGGFAQLFF